MAAPILLIGEESPDSNRAGWPLTGAVPRQKLRDRESATENTPSA